MLLIKSQSRTEIAHQSAKNFVTKSVNKVSLVPLASDLKVLSVFLTDEGTKLGTKLRATPVSYTHLDVYKRQTYYSQQ